MILERDVRYLNRLLGFPLARLQHYKVTALATQIGPPRLRQSAASATPEPCPAGSPAMFGRVLECANQRHTCRGLAAASNHMQRSWRGNETWCPAYTGGGGM